MSIVPLGNIKCRLATLHLAALRKALPPLLALNHILLLTTGIFRNDNCIKISGGQDGI